MNEEKDLGVCITNNLKAASQCQLAYSKANKVLGLIARTISYKNTDVLLQLYKTLVRPHLEYRVTTWSPQGQVTILERVQHRFARMIPGLKSMPYDEKRLEHLGLWSLEERRHRADLLEVFKMYKGSSLLPFSHFFTLSTVTTTRRHTAKIGKNMLPIRSAQILLLRTSD